MPNHDHLLLQTPRPDLPDGMKLLNAAYTQYFNARHRQVGHLFQGRYKAHLVQDDTYFREISRYLHLNPVRAAGMPDITDPADYPWSSFGDYLRPARRRKWITCQSVLARYAPGTQTARAKQYAAYVRAGIDAPPESPWKQAHAGAVIGSDAFFQGIKKRLKLTQADPERPETAAMLDRPELATVVQRCADALNADPADWSPGRRSRTPDRALTAFICRRLGYRGSEVAAALGYRNGAGVNKAIQRVNDSKSLTSAVKRLEKAVVSMLV